VFKNLTNRGIWKLPEDPTQGEAARLTGALEYSRNAGEVQTVV
jgi:hypothetical protein